MRFALSITSRAGVLTVASVDMARDRGWEGRCSGRSEREQEKKDLGKRRRVCWEAVNV